MDCQIVSVNLLLLTGQALRASVCIGTACRPRSSAHLSRLPVGMVSCGSGVACTAHSLDL